MLCLLLKQKTAIVRPGSLGFGRGVGQCRKIVWQGPVKKIRPIRMVLEISWVIWGSAGVILECRIAESQCIIKYFVKHLPHQLCLND